MIKRNRQDGFSLAELLTVIAIIGVMSLVSVPAFMNYQRSLELKNAMRMFTTDLRTAQRRAVANNTTVTVNVPASGVGKREYTVIQAKNAGGIGSIPQNRRFTSDVAFFADTGTITFRPNGTTSGTTSIKIDSKNAYGKKNYTVTVNMVGRVSVQ